MESAKICVTYTCLDNVRITLEWRSDEENHGLYFDVHLIELCRLTKWDSDVITINLCERNNGSRKKRHKQD